jgi:hypothetical protein
MPQSTDFGGATQPDIFIMMCLLQNWYLIILIDDKTRSPMEQAECFEMEFFRDFFRFKFKWPFIVDLPIAELDLPMVCKARRAHHRDPPAAQQLSPTGLRWSSLPPPPQRA